MIFISEGGDQARLCPVLENHGEVENNGIIRTLHFAESERMADLRSRLVIGWRSPHTWRMNVTAAASYSVIRIADAEAIPFPGFDRPVLSRVQSAAVKREQRYTSWRTALPSVVGVYLIADTRHGWHYVGKAAGLETIRQRWDSYTISRYGGNVEIRRLDPTSLRFSLLRVFKPFTPTRDIDIAKSHFKDALDSRWHGLNRN